MKASQTVTQEEEKAKKFLFSLRIYPLPPSLSAIYVVSIYHIISLLPTKVGRCRPDAGVNWILQLPFLYTHTHTAQN